MKFLQVLSVETWKFPLRSFFGASLYRAGLQLVAVFFVRLLSGADLFGSYSVLLAASLCGSFLESGMYPRGLTGDCRRIATRPMFILVLAVSAMSTAVATALLAVVLSLNSRLHEFISWNLVVPILFLLSVARSSSQLITAQLLSTGREGRAATFVSIWSSFALIGTVVPLLTRPSPLTILGGNAVGMLLGVLPSLVYWGSLAPTGSALKLRVVFAGAAATFGSMLFAQADKVLVGSFLSPSRAGSYALVVLLVSQVNTWSATSIQSECASLFASPRVHFRDFVRIQRRCNRVVSVVGLGVAGFFIVSYFFDLFESRNVVLAALFCLGVYILYSVNAPATFYLMANRGLRPLATFGIWASLSSLLAIFLLGKAFGLPGAIAGNFPYLISSLALCRTADHLGVARRVLLRSACLESWPRLGVKIG